MNDHRSKLLRTTVVQAFARTLADPSRRTGVAPRSSESAPDTEVTPGPPGDMGLPDVGDVVGGHYKLDSLLGQGGFGQAYLATRVTRSRAVPGVVAIKADEGIKLKRMKPMSRGKGGAMMKRHSHITVVVSDGEA